MSSSNCLPARLTKKNIAEKKRRDKINGFISDLATNVPIMSQSLKKLDKSNVLRLSASYLRINKCFLFNKTCESKKWRPNFINANQLKDYLESLDGFFFLANGAGKLLYVSSSCFTRLGHQNVEMIGFNLTSFIHPTDVEYFKKIMESAKKSLTKNGLEIKVYFKCRLRKKNPSRSNIYSYQAVKISAVMGINRLYSKFLKNKRSKDRLSSSSSNNNCISNYLENDEIIFKGCIEVIDVSPHLSLIESCQDEYVIRMKIDGTIIFADHRISLITGFLPSEVIDKSGYNFIYNEDRDIAFFAHRLMFSSSDGKGEIVHRLKTSSKKLIYVQTTGWVQYNQNDEKFEHFCCVVRVLMKEEGEKEREKFYRKFSSHFPNCCNSFLFHTNSKLSHNFTSSIAYQNPNLVKNIGSDESTSQTPTYPLS